MRYLPLSLLLLIRSQDNELSFIPQWLSRFTKLGLLNIERNPVTSVPVGIDTVAKRLAARIKTYAAAVGDVQRGPAVPSLRELASRYVTRHNIGPLSRVHP